MKMDFTKELDCPICFERFSSPRSLNSCLHTFCEDCLFQTFASFERNTRNCKELPCPVCRKTVAVPKAGVTKEWIKTFPVNHVVNSLLHISVQEVDSDGPHCEPCSDRNQNSSVQAVNVCVECQEFMCQPCSQHHKFFKFTKGHNIISFNELKSEKKGPIVTSKEDFFECQTHGDKCVELFCVDHNVPVCAVCVATGHRQCIDIVQLKIHAESSDVVATTKQKQKSLKSMQKTLTSNIKQKLQNELDLKAQESEIVEYFENKRSKVLSLLKAYESEVLEEFKFLRDKKLTELSEDIQKSKHFFSSVKSASIAIDSVLKRGSKAVTYATLVGMESQFAQYESMMAKNYNMVHNEKVAVIDRYPMTAFLGSKSLGYAELQEYAPTISADVSTKVKALHAVPAVNPRPQFNLDSDREEKRPVTFTFANATNSRTLEGFTFLGESDLNVSEEVVSDEGEGHVSGFDRNVGSSAGGMAAQNGTQATQEQASAARGNISRRSELTDSTLRSEHKATALDRIPMPRYSQSMDYVRQVQESVPLYQERNDFSGLNEVREVELPQNDWNDVAPSRYDRDTASGHIYVYRPDNHQLYVANIPLTMEEDELQEFFEEYGTVEDVTIREGEGEAIRNYGFVTFDSPEPVLQILDSEPIYINGHRLKVGKKRSKTKRESMVGRGGFGRGRGSLN